jgi:hypothetical protein
MKKFKRDVDARAAQKRQIGRISEVSCLTRNTNIRADGEGGRGKRGRSQANTNVGEDAQKSLFNHVLKRRKSRQSVYAPTNLDFDYAGNSSHFQHLIDKRPEGQGFPNKTQLNFEFNLRNYKNTTEFLAGKPFLFPSVRQFSPRHQWEATKRDQNLINAEFRKKFNDTFAQKNANDLRHQFDKNGLNSTAQWQCALRGLKRLPKDHGAKRTSPSKN